MDNPYDLMICLVFHINNRLSLRRVKAIYDELASSRIILIATHIDLWDEHSITEEEIQEFRSHRPINHYFKVSAKTNEGIDNLRDYLMQWISLTPMLNTPADPILFYAAPQTNKASSLLRRLLCAIT